MILQNFDCLTSISNFFFLKICIVREDFVLTKLAPMPHHYYEYSNCSAVFKNHCDAICGCNWRHRILY